MYMLKYVFLIRRQQTHKPSSFPPLSFSEWTIALTKHRDEELNPPSPGTSPTGNQVFDPQPRDEDHPLTCWQHACAHGWTNARRRRSCFEMAMKQNAPSSGGAVTLFSGLSENHFPPSPPLFIHFPFPLSSDRKVTQHSLQNCAYSWQTSTLYSIYSNVLTKRNPKRIRHNLKIYNLSLLLKTNLENGEISSLVFGLHQKVDIRGCCLLAIARKAGPRLSLIQFRKHAGRLLDLISFISVH